MKPLAVTPARCLAASAVLAVVWLLGSHFIVPVLIAKAYHGQLHPLIDRVISGQHVHDVAYYVHYWKYVSRIAVITILAAGVAGFLVRNRQEGGRLPLLDHLADQDTLSVKQSLRFGGIALALAVGIGVLSSFVGTGLGYQTVVDAVMKERGPIQLATFSFLALGTLFSLMIAWAYRASRTNFLLIALLMTAYACRELDFPIMLRMGRPNDKWVPFFQGSSSILAKLWFVLLILAIVASIFALIRRKAIFQALARRETWAVYGAVWAVMLVISQFIDKAPIGIELKYSTFEEPFEMCTAAVCFLSLYSLAYRET